MLVWRNGRRTGLKILRGQLRVGSSPTTSTIGKPTFLSVFLIQSKGLERAAKKSCLCASFLRPGVINEKTALLIHFENKFQNFIWCLFFHFTTRRNSRSAGELVVTFFVCLILCFYYKFLNSFSRLFSF